MFIKDFTKKSRFPVVTIVSNDKVKKKIKAKNKDKNKKKFLINIPYSLPLLG